jgi:hypothetical protein
MAILVVVVLVLVLGVYGYTVYRSTTVQASLADAQSRSAPLLAQQATFSQAKSTNDAISQIKEALTVGTSSEVLWSDLYAVVQNHVPSGDRITTATLTARAPFDAPLTLPGPLSSPKVADIVVAISMASPDDVPTFMQSIQQESTVAGVTLADFSGAGTQYVADFRVDFNVQALSHRFPSGEASK